MWALQTQVENINSDNGQQLLEELQQLQEDIDSEVASRKSEDEKLQGAITEEITNRTNADNNLQNLIGGETSTRANQFSILQEALNSEVSSRISQDSSIQEKLDAEILARTNQDETLQSAISSEAESRQSADDNLQAQIDVLQVAGSGLSVSAENKSGGYCKLSNGLIFQWGTYVLDQYNAGTKNITLPTPFSTTTYGVVSSHYTGTISNDYINSFKITARTKTYFTVKKHFGEMSEQALWIAIGY